MCCHIFYYFINSVTTGLYLSRLVTRFNSDMFYCDNKTRLQHLFLSGTRSKSSLSVADFIFYQEHIFKLLSASSPKPNLRLLATLTFQVLVIVCQKSFSSAVLVYG